MDIKTTCACGTETTVSAIDALKASNTACKNCGAKATVEVTKTRGR